MTKHPRKHIAKAAARKPAQKHVAKTKLAVKRRVKGSLGRTLSRRAGSAIGSLVGLGELGTRAGDAFADLMGMGAYKLNSNSIMSDSTQAPLFNHGKEDTIIEHAELICDINGSTSFAATQLIIDPTDSTTFPLLSSIARNYEQYEFLGLVLTYKPTSGSAIASTNNALGTVIIATQYDVSRQPFISKAEMEAYHFATSCEPCHMMHHPIECNPHLDVLNSRYVNGPARLTRSSSRNPSTQSVQANLQLLGRTQIATVGMQAAVTVGELWATYKVRLITPRKPGPSNFQGYLHVTGLADLPIGSATAYGNSYNIVSDSTSSLAAMAVTTNGTETRITTTGLPPRTNIMLTLSVQGGASGTVTQPTFTTSNVSFSNSFYIGSATASSQASVQAGNGTRFMIYCANFFTLDDSYTNQGYIALPAPTIAVATAVWDLTVSVIPYPAYTGSTPILITASVHEEIARQQETISALESQMQSLLSHNSNIMNNHEPDEVKTTSAPNLNLNVNTSTPSANAGWTLMRKY